MKSALASNSSARKRKIKSPLMSQKNTLDSYFSTPKKIYSTPKATVLSSDKGCNKTLSYPKLSKQDKISSPRRNLKSTPVKNGVMKDKPTLNTTGHNIISDNAENDENIDDLYVSQDLKKEIGSNFGEGTNVDVNLISSNVKTPKPEKYIGNKTPIRKVRSKHDLECNKSEIASTYKIRVSAGKFKEIIYNFYIDDYSKNYKKLNSKIIPDCCNPATCDKRHKDTDPMEIGTIKNATFFNILDNPLSNWLYDYVSNAAFSVLRPDQYFREDVLRILFDYILNGTSENHMRAIKHILSSHFQLHPPCTEKMRQFYLHLLDQAYNCLCRFETELTSDGVLSYVMKKLKMEVLQDIGGFADEKQSESDDSQSSQPITFELLEERHNNFQPLLDDEYKEVMDNIGDIMESSFRGSKMHLQKNTIIKRLTEALELIIDLLESDFLICVSKLKRYIADENESSKVQMPLIQSFMNSDFISSVFEMYAKTTNTALWRQLTRLIGIMAEQVHLFKLPVERLWEYPNIHEDCSAFATSFCSAVEKRDWDSSVQLQRLRAIQPPWLRYKVAMTWVNFQLNIRILDSDLTALVEIIHMHVKSPVKLEKPVRKVKCDKRVITRKSLVDIKKVTKKNQYGETKLHILCQRRNSSIAEIQSALAMPETDINAKDNNGYTPLHKAVIYASVLKTKLLLQHQILLGKSAVDIGAQNKAGSTPLHEAVRVKSLELCKLLVDHGGVSLLRKTNNSGETPLECAKDPANEVPDILQYFKGVMRKQEQLNLSPDSELNIGDHVIRMLMIACDAFFLDYHTWELYCVLKSEGNNVNASHEKFIIISKATLIKFSEAQTQLRKLRRILGQLAENPTNSALVKLWSSKLQNR
ncbi:uncharacterized protein LOC124357354 isoform X1 [Homalodisca vitripennis]|uniref:uncharacterized protein LOC124357354 isoform X1 n=1 Tax=Homalodisca vitripennis TaxID=197043 RepID=UPI001EEADFC6|nr:uncharacterized protein LOC124357354 isoform X1 [Homalodisca vitripennis]XP_046665027.1 uncharacterized protein LOC124357354 isoform X1 [Homalodisca vitripennis]